MTDITTITSNTAFVGLDVHKESIALAVLRAERIEIEKTIPHDYEALVRVLSPFSPVSCCYEAGAFGFELQRHLTGHGLDCAVIAPGLVPAKPGDKVKTDRRDARSLAMLYGHGLLTAIHIPDPHVESARDLIRAREDTRVDRIRHRQRLSAFLLRRNRPLPSGSWGTMRRRWLGCQRFEDPLAQQAFDSYLHALDIADSRMQHLEQMIAQVAACEPFAPLVGKLCCMRGIGTLTALALVVEVDDFSRFESAAAFMSFVGLVPSERSSGSTVRRGPITKVGNSLLRRLLVESGWHARHHPNVSESLAMRQRGQDPVTIERAWRAQKRLHLLWTRMTARNKPSQKIAVACARELAGFVWATATDQPLIHKAAA